MDIGECWDQKPLDTKHSHEVNNLVVFFNVISSIVMSQIPVAMFGCRLLLHITNINFYYCNETVEYDLGNRKWITSGVCSCFRESILHKDGHPISDEVKDKIVSPISLLNICFVFCA